MDSVHPPGAEVGQDGARAVALRSAELTFATIVNVFGAGSDEVTEAERHLAVMRENGNGSGDLEAFFVAEGRLVDVERKARARMEPQGEAATESNSVLVRLDSVKAEKVTWLWPGRIPFGKLTILDGDPGKGKSAVSVDLGARVTVGDSMPGETTGRAPAGVVILTAEDGLADTVRPRVEVAGGDPSRIVALDAVRLPSGACRMPTLSDVENLRDAIGTVKARLVIIDPIMAYLGTKDGHKDQDVRSLAHPLAHLADETGVAVLLIRHLTKGEKMSPIYRGGGSIGIAGAARSVLLVGDDRDDPELRVLASVKSNLSAPPPSLGYRLVPENDVVRVAWEGPVNVTATALLAAQTPETRSRVDWRVLKPSCSSSWPRGQPQAGTCSDRPGRRASLTAP